MHSENVIVSHIIRYKLLSAASILAENYRYLCFKYDIAHIDWYQDINFVTKKIFRKYTSNELAITHTITELCKLRDGVVKCQFVNNINISTLIDLLCTE